MSSYSFYQCFFKPGVRCKKEAEYEVGGYFSIIFLPEVLLGGGGICNATKFEVKTAFCKP